VNLRKGNRGDKRFSALVLFLPLWPVTRIRFRSLHRIQLRPKSASRGCHYVSKCGRELFLSPLVVRFNIAN
jgi:hypothetical protein